MIFTVHGALTGTFAARVRWVADHVGVGAGGLGLALLMPGVGALPVALVIAGFGLLGFGIAVVVPLVFAAAGRLGEHPGRSIAGWPASRTAVA